jgi:hypothetical protein
MQSYLNQILDLEENPWDKYRVFDGKNIQYVCTIKFLPYDLLQRIKYK